MKVQKRPIILDATQWFKHGDHKKVKKVPLCHSLWDAAGGSIAHNYGHIDTLEDGHIVTPGDWIVGPGVAGEFWPVKPDVFLQTYVVLSQAQERPKNGRKKRLYPVFGRKR